MTIIDQQERERATDPTQSFIVQAPAGSGKTEILTQRYLRLLSTVSAPEQIVALTFTRKAASEMRARILSALQQAFQELPGLSAHQTLTQRYAREALQHSHSLDWQLLNQPARLKILTIDSLCQSLVQAVVLQQSSVAHAAITETPGPLYKLAVRACLEDVAQQEAWQEPLSGLLYHLDNRQDKLQELLCALLATRDQWLGPLYSAREQTRAHCERALAEIEQHGLARFKHAIPVHCADELLALSREAAALEANPQSPRAALLNFFEWNQLDRTFAQSLAALLLTKDDKLRKAFDHHVGIKLASCEKKQYQQFKNQSKQLLLELSENPDFLAALIHIKNMPPPVYEEGQWEVLQTLLALLPVLAAHFEILCQETQQTDFSAISQQALAALGSEEDPTDLALYLDNTIHHLLVDEFQDTSLSQFELLTKLTQGWLADDHKTLFLVGDPMQSIYRFRQAEVGLFLKAKKEGIGSRQLRFLELRCNFRAAPCLVDWVNQQFKTIFPRHDDIESGAVSFHPATAAKMHEGSISAIECADKDQEACAIVDIASKELEAHPAQTIAILVRSRAQLAALISLLREKAIPFQGVDIVKLSHLPHIVDALSLTKALLMPANRLAWLALLRSPWGGIELADLLLIAQCHKDKPIYYALSQHSHITGLSDNARQRAQFIYQVLESALNERHHVFLIPWLINVMQQLHGDTLLNLDQKRDLEQFFALLERFTKDNQISDWEEFEKACQELYSRRAQKARLQIMTIHKSKGLEFDTVLLPSLGSVQRARDNPLLRWIKLPQKQHGDLLLLSPIPAASDKNSALYQYIGNILAEKDAYEQQRLLYVAVTRAKTRLYLFDHHENIASQSFRALLKNQEFVKHNPEETLTPLEPQLPLLSRLPQFFY